MLRTVRSINCSSCASLKSVSLSPVMDAPNTRNLCERSAFVAVPASDCPACSAAFSSAIGM